MTHDYSHALSTKNACWVYHVESVSKMGLVLSITFAIYGVACVELAYSSLGDWKGIFITHVIIFIESEVSTFPIAVIFFRGCVSEMVVLSYSVIFYIHVPGTLGPCFHYWCSVYGVCKWSDTLWYVGCVRLFADYTISLSSLCRPIWRHWATKMLVWYMLPMVLDSDHSLNYILFDIWGCVSSAYPIILWWSCECVLYLIIIIKSEVWIINHCLGLGHKTMVSAVSYYVLTLSGRYNGIYLIMLTFT